MPHAIIYAFDCRSAAGGLLNDAAEPDASATNATREIFKLMIDPKNPPYRITKLNYEELERKLQDAGFGLLGGLGPQPAVALQLVQDQLRAISTWASDPANITWINPADPA